MYTVRRLAESAAAYGDVLVDAKNHRDAAREFGPRPGDHLIVSDGRTVVRYHVNQSGRIVEQSRYSTGE